MQNAIDVRDLTKHYGEKCVLDNLCLKVKRGCVFGLLGANGAGKSTSIECILGTKKKDSGEVQILGLNPERDRKMLFQRIGGAVSSVQLSAGNKSL